MTDKQFEEYFTSINKQFENIDKRFDMVQDQIKGVYVVLDKTNDRLEGKIQEVNDRLEGKIQEVKEELKTEISELDEKFDTKISELDEEFDTKLSDTKKDILKEFNRKMNINSREHSNIIDVIENRYEDIEGRITDMKEKSKVVV